MKISIGCNIQSGPFGGGNQLNRALADYFVENGYEVEFDLSSNDIDLIILVDPRKNLRSISFGDKEILAYINKKNPNALVLQVVHECDERKGTKGLNNRLAWANRVANSTVFISNWQQNLFHDQNYNINNDCVIRNGSNEKIFNWDGESKWNGKEPMKIVTHHWSNNWMKGFDIYEKIDMMLNDDKWRDRIEFTYIGNIPKNFKFINAKIIEPLADEKLANELSKHHAYVTGSLNEPAGLHHIEGALTGLPILYRESGALPEYCNNFGESFSGTDDFIQALDRLIDNYNLWTEKLLSYPYTFENMCKKYKNLIESMMSNRDSLIAEREKSLSLKWRLFTLLGLTPRYTS